jgi:hypothetical protein
MAATRMQIVFMAIVMIPVLAYLVFVLVGR